jgi:acyl carrier protein
MEEQIREVLAAHGRLPVPVEALGLDDDLSDAGLSSHALVNVMLALEDAFDVEFPEYMLREKATFESIGSIAAAIGELSPARAAS